MEEKSNWIDGVRRLPVRVKDYFQELQAEMRRVTWPNRKQVQSTTAVVVVTVFAFAAYFAVVDSFFAATIGRLFNSFAKQ